MKKKAKVITAYIMCFILMFGFTINKPMISYAESLYFSGEGNEASPYIISTADDLIKLRDLVNDGNTDYNNKYYSLQNDIDLSGIANWTSIGIYGANSFAGTFDGNGHRIEGMNIKAEGNGSGEVYIGLFGYISYGTVKNLSLINSNIQASNFESIYAGGIASFSSGTITNSSSTGSVSVTASINSYAGGLAGYSTGTVTDSYNTANVSACTTSPSSYSNAGGAAGFNTGAIINSYNTGKISSKSLRENSNVYSGGIVGGSYGKVEKCHNNGNVSALSFGNNGGMAGGIAGCVFSGDTINTVTDCYNTGSVTSNSDSGGIVGWASPSYIYGKVTISNCYNLGSVSGYSMSGGIAGRIFERITISNCYNRGEVTESIWAGGIAGYSMSSIISNCFNLGPISAKEYLGGIIGQTSNSKIENCYNTGTVTALSWDFTPHMGGIAGYAYYSVTITNCYSLDTISGVGNGTQSTNSCTLEQMQQQSTYSGFDFDTVWMMPPDISYTPVLKSSYVPLEGISLEDTAMVTGEKRYILKTAPMNSTITDCSWISTNTEAAAVDSRGIITGAAPGETYIIAVSKQGGYTASSILTVNQGVESISIPSSLNLFAGDVTQLQAQVLPLDSYNPALSWTSSNTSVAAVDQNGKISSINPGTAVITAAAADGSGAQAKCFVTVLRSVTGVDISNPPGSIKVGQTSQLNAVVAPSDASNNSVTWASSDPSIAAVNSNGEVTGISRGTVTITVTTVDGGFTASCQVEVIQPVTGITLDRTSTGIATGRQIKLTAAVAPADADNQNIIWSSSDESAATVSSDGVVSGISEGSAVITAKSEDGSYLAYCVVTVGQGVTDIVVIGPDQVDRQSSISMTAALSPVTAVNKTVIWSVIPGTGSGTISADGLFTGTGIGMVTVIATAADGMGITGQKTVTVNEKKCTIVFDNNGGDTEANPAASVVIYNGLIAPPAANPSKSGYTFGGWYKDAACTNAWNFIADKVTSDTTLYAKWIMLSNEKPVITGAVNKTIKVGDTFDVKAGVTASDKEDGSLTAKIIVSGSVDISKAGQYTVTYSVTDSNGNKVSKSITISVAARNIEVIPLIGSSRYDTAVKLSQSQFTASDTVIVVNGGAMADGLGATPLAAYKNAPLLLTETRSLPEATANEIKRLHAKNAIIVGGIGVVSDDVKLQLQALGLSAERISGSSRYGTSLAVAKYIDQNCYDVSRIVIANGYGEADALSIASAAGRDIMPIILAERDNVTAEVYDWLKSENIENAFIIGGVGVVSDNVLNKIDGITSGDIRNNRLGGKNRFETNSLVIDRFFGSVIDKTYIAKGYVLIDALAAGSVAAVNGAPVVLTGNDLTEDQKSVLGKRYGNTIIRTGGGISETAVGSLEKCLQ